MSPHLPAFMSIRDNLSKFLSTNIKSLQSYDKNSLFSQSYV